MTDGIDIEALKYHAENGDAGSQYKMGALHATGMNVAQDKAAALNWWRMAAAQGHVDAICQIGWAYYDGEGVPRNLIESARWFHSAAKQGCKNAQDMLKSMGLS